MKQQWANVVQYSKEEAAHANASWSLHGRALLLCHRLMDSSGKIWVLHIYYLQSTIRFVMQLQKQSSFSHFQAGRSYSPQVKIQTLSSLLIRKTKPVVTHSDSCTFWLLFFKWIWNKKILQVLRNFFSITEKALSCGRASNRCGCPHGIFSSHLCCLPGQIYQPEQWQNITSALSHY